MQAWQGRVVKEKEALDKNIAALGEFLEYSLSVDPAEHERLTLQYKIMQDYSAVLGARIENFKEA